MHLIPREVEKLTTICQLGFLAQRRLTRGVRLNHAEAVALISSVLHEFIRDGHYAVADLMSIGRTILGRRHVLPSTWFTLDQIQVEGTFPTGTYLVTVHNPIATEQGNMERALYGSCIPVPDKNLLENLFPEVKAGEFEDHKAPGYVEYKHGKISLNHGKKRRCLKVQNTGDRPIQVGSHYHFIETNRKLCFNREHARGFRLDVPAGMSIRFEPGQCREVDLVEVGGSKKLYGGNGIESDPSYDYEEDGFCNTAEPRLTPRTARTMSHAEYAEAYGPTTGDVIRLGLTDLYVVVERDCRDCRDCCDDNDQTYYGDECNFGGGKTIRDGMGQTSRGASAETAVHVCADTVITNVVIIDYDHIIKADIGIKEGKITGIGRGGNPDTMDGVDPGIIIGANTDVIAGENKIITAGGLDTHVHFLDPAQVPEALCNGLTTLVGGGTGPSTGSNATTCTPGPLNIKRMMQAFDHLPVNVGITGKGNNSFPEGLVEQIEAGAIGMKLHEDWGATHMAIKECVKVCKDYDVQGTIHTDTMNEYGYVDDTIRSIGLDNTIHAYHTEGAGGGHAPDIIKVVQYDRILPASTNPTRPYTINTVDEHLDMVMVAHHLSKNIPADVAFAESRIRAETIAAEDYLHDIGAISIMSSDSQAMGRIGEVILRTWNTAHKMAAVRDQLDEDKVLQSELTGYTGQPIQNFRVKRYISKYTINPAITHGMSHVIGSIKKGMLADLVLWTPRNFGTKPNMVLKSGMIVASLGGDPNGSIPTIEPMIMRPQFATYVPETSVMFVSKASAGYKNSDDLTANPPPAPSRPPKVDGYNLKKCIMPVTGCSSVTKGMMKWNSAKPQIDVDPETFVVTADGKVCDVPPATSLPLTQDYFVF